MKEVGPNPIETLPTPDEPHSPAEADPILDLRPRFAATETASFAIEGGDTSRYSAPRLQLQSYIPEKHRDYVRLIVTVGLLAMLGWVIVWSCIEAASWPSHWAQTKEMLQTILPALTGLIGSVIGFYFGSRGNESSIGNAGRGRSS